MERYTLKKPDCIKKKKRVGCGIGSGHGKTSCRGQKGQLSRSGSKRKPGFEGGQMPLQRRIPKRGFKNLFKVEYQLVNISIFDKLALTEVTAEVLLNKGYIQKIDLPIKILGNGKISKSVKIHADAYSASAAEKIKKAGGEAVIRASETGK